MKTRRRCNSAGYSWVMDLFWGIFQSTIQKRST